MAYGKELRVMKSSTRILGFFQIRLKQRGIETILKKNFAKVYSAQTTFLSAKIIDIEVDLSKALHAFTIVGLPDKAVEESRDRVSAAIKNYGFKSPKSKNQKIIISLAPADIK